MGGAMISATDYPWIVKAPKAYERTRDLAQPGLCFSVSEINLSAYHDWLLDNATGQFELNGKPKSYSHRFYWIAFEREDDATLFVLRFGGRIVRNLPFT